MADFAMVQKLRAESKQKSIEAEKAFQEMQELEHEIRRMRAQLEQMEAHIETLIHNGHRLRLESDRLKNQAFVMSLGSNQ